MDVTHPKVASLRPDWAPFAGCTILFGTTAPGSEGVSAPADLYATLADAMERHTQGWGRFALCPLPPSTYHVTLADLVNDGNVAKLPPERRATVMGGASRSEAMIAAVRDLVERSGILELKDEAVTFRVRKVENAGNRVLLTRLDPVESQAYTALMAARQRLSAFLAEVGIKLQGYDPHVSLAYFANETAPADIGPELASLDAAVQAATAGQRYGFGGPLMATFHDMADFRADR